MHGGIEKAGELNGRWVRRCGVTTAAAAVAVVLVSCASGAASTRPVATATAATATASKTFSLAPNASETTPAAAPTPAANALPATQSGTINETDADGYTYTVDYNWEVGRFASDISQAKPGYFDAVATAGTQVIQVTNSTPGRAAPGGGTWQILGLYSLDSPVCKQGLALGLGSSTWTPEYGTVTTLKTKAGEKYCALNLSIQYESATDAGIPSGGAIPAYNSISRDPDLRMAGIPEAATESILAALNSPVTVVVNLGDQTDDSIAELERWKLGLWKPAEHGCLLDGTRVDIRINPKGAVPVDSKNVTYAVYDSSDSHSVCG
jgi:hypothetical protein